MFFLNILFIAAYDVKVLVIIIAVKIAYRRAVSPPLACVKLFSGGNDKSFVNLAPFHTFHEAEAHFLVSGVSAVFVFVLKTEEDAPHFSEGSCFIPGEKIAHAPLQLVNFPLVSGINKGLLVYIH